MERVRLTNERISSFTCPVGKQQAFLWDTESPSLAVRVTAAGAKSFIFESKLNRLNIRITLGDVRTWVLNSIWTGKGSDKKETQRGAREEAGRLKAIVDQGKDPRQLAADEIATEHAKRSETKRHDVLVLTAWTAYIADRTPKWSERHLLDHQLLASTGGKPAKTRGKGRKTEPGALSALMSLKMSELTKDRIRSWLKDESSTRATQAALAFRLLRAFLNWCDDQKDYGGIVAKDACSSRVARDTLPKSKVKTDALQKEQLSAWFNAVREIQNKKVSTYLQILLLTGARRTELNGLRWDDIDFRWNTVTIRDKVEGEREIPLTPYVSALLSELKTPTVVSIKTPPTVPSKPSPWVFSSDRSKTGRLQDPMSSHIKACKRVEIHGLTLHGLRRSFSSLAEWVEMPAGIEAQIMGHKPSATAEKHYKPRPIDLLRLWHTKYERWILEQAKVPFIYEADEELKQISVK